VSRVHLQFARSQQDDIFRVLNVSSGNPVYVNGKELGPGVECPVENDDKIIVGGYVLQLAYSSTDTLPQVFSARHADVAEEGQQAEDELSVMLRDAADAMMEEEAGKDGEGSLDPLALFGDGAEIALSEILRLDEPVQSVSARAGAMVQAPGKDRVAVERIFRAFRKHMLDRLDPEVIVGSEPANGLLDRVLPFMHKARLWDEYVRHFRKFRASVGEGHTS